MEFAEERFDDLIDTLEDEYQRLDDRDIRDGRQEVLDIAIYHLRCSRERYDRAKALAHER